MYKRILVPVDGSASANRGLQEALRLARNQKARLVLLHVVEEQFVTQAAEAMVFSEKLFEAMRASGRKVLARAEALARKGGVKALAVLRESVTVPVADMVVREARRQRADLIVIGTHGRRGLTRAVMGSDAEDVVRSSPVPVLLVRARR
ncbi:MAG: universal stress protein [Burkholderiales bacterium]